MRKWLGRLRNAIRPGRLDRDLERELRFHVTERTEELQEAGMSAEAAARLARKQFGNTLGARERSADEWRFLALDDVAHDVRFGLRWGGFCGDPALVASRNLPCKE